MNKNPVTREEMATALTKLSESLSQRLSVLEAGQVAMSQTLSKNGSGSNGSGSDGSDESSRAREEQPGHPYGLCSDPACASCVAQGNAIAQAVMGQAIPEARNAALSELHTALTWAGGEALASRVMGVAEAWVKAGRPDPKPEPALMVVEG